MEFLAANLHALMLVLMVALFGAIVIWTYAPGRRRSLDEAGRIPLEDDTPRGGR